MPTLIMSPDEWDQFRRAQQDLKKLKREEAFIFGIGEGAARLALAEFNGREWLTEAAKVHFTKIGGHRCARDLEGPEDFMDQPDIWKRKVA